MKTVAVEDLIIETILTFCENAAELGCPKDKEVDMWIRELPYEEQYKIAEKMLDIVDRDNKRFKDETPSEEISDDTMQK